MPERKNEIADHPASANEFERFKELTKKLVRVPKKELDKQLRKEKPRHKNAA